LSNFNKTCFPRQIFGGKKAEIANFSLKSVQWEQSCSKRTNKTKPIVVFSQFLRKATRKTKIRPFFERLACRQDPRPRRRRFTGCHMGRPNRNGTFQPSQCDVLNNTDISYSGVTEVRQWVPISGNDHLDHKRYS